MDVEKLRELVQGRICDICKDRDITCEAVTIFNCLDLGAYPGERSVYIKGKHSGNMPEKIDKCPALRDETAKEIAVAVIKASAKVENRPTSAD